MISVLAALCIFILITLFIAARLWSSRFGPWPMALLLFFLVVQLAAALSAALLPALALALFLAFASEAARGLAQTQSARGVVALGVSLAATQFASPLGVVVAAILAPALAFHAPGETKAKNAGLLLLLLFVPVATALLLAYLAHEVRFDPFVHLVGPFDATLRRQIFDPSSPRANGLIEAFAMVVMAFPIWFAVWRSRSVSVTALVASTLIAAVIVTALLGRSRSLGAFVPSLAVLNVLSFTEPESDPLLPVHVVSLSALSTMASWIFIALPV
ncbi:MAG: hypothetical protein ACTHPD_09510 [Rhizomicrobium sp.]